MWSHFGCCFAGKLGGRVGVLYCNVGQYSEPLEDRSQSVDECEEGKKRKKERGEEITQEPKSDSKHVKLTGRVRSAEGTSERVDNSRM